MKKLLLTFSLLTGLFANSQVVTDYNRIEIEGFYTNPVVSPDSKYVLLSGEHLKGVFLLNLSDNSIATISSADGSGYAYSWNKDSNSFYFKEKGSKEYFTDAKVYQYSLADKKKSVVEEVNHNYLPSYKGFEKDTERQIVIYTNTATLKIEAKDLKSSKYWTVTNDEGQFYNAILSHDGKKVAVHNGADIYVYQTDGSGKGIKIGRGLATGWSKDDTFLIGFLDESNDGHRVTNSEIYWYDVTNARAKKITTSEVISEMFPSLYDEDKVIFSDDKTGRIYTATLKM